MINRLIQDELIRSNSIHRPYFASAHEGESIIKEEIDEIEDEIQNIKRHFDNLWKAVKYNQAEDQYTQVCLVRHYCYNAIEELIQIGAMCDKFKKSQKDGWKYEERI